MATIPVAPSVAELAAALGIGEPEAVGLLERAGSEGLVEPWTSPDGPVIGLTCLGASLLGVKVSGDGRRWVPASRPDHRQAGNGRRRTVGETDGSLDLDAFAGREREPLQNLLLSEARAEWAADQRERRRTPPVDQTARRTPAPNPRPATKPGRRLTAPSDLVAARLAGSRNGADGRGGRGCGVGPAWEDRSGRPAGPATGRQEAGRPEA